eukprot:TRINITY_DN89136_c0_g1_i1.p1 TRINITY_DN89136_c0_g1~~TRINITY_DN89136_c0_g1_i1.p1  ORF type:complete len:114 (+),score=10.84 TRINITY_DN89136_c0_g1_i1:88-429(+)
MPVRRMVFIFSKSRRARSGDSGDIFTTLPPRSWGLMGKRPRASPIMSGAFFTLGIFVLRRFLAGTGVHSLGQPLAQNRHFLEALAQIPDLAIRGSRLLFLGHNGPLQPGGKRS